MKYAVIEVDGKQFKVSPSTTFYIDKFVINKDKGEVIFDKVLLAEGDDLKIGAPYLEGIEVVCEIGDKVKTEKVVAETFKAKSRYHRKIGLKKTFLPITVKDIRVKGEKKEEQKPVVKKRAIKKSS